jgi:hypothetical protein
LKFKPFAPEWENEAPNAVVWVDVAALTRVAALVPVDGLRS